MDRGVQTQEEHITKKLELLEREFLGKIDYWGVEVGGRNGPGSKTSSFE